MTSEHTGVSDARLLTPSQAARYLGYLSPEVLKGLAIEPIRLSAVGLGSGPRYDRRVLDAFIDRLVGRGSLSPRTEPIESTDEAEADLQAWRASRNAKKN